MQAPDPNLKLEVVYESANAVELELAQSALEDAGIEFAVNEEALPGYGFSPMLNPPSRILVAENAAEQARDLLAGLPDEAADEEDDEDEEDEDEDEEDESEE